VTPRSKYVETNGRGASPYDLERDPRELEDLVDKVDATTLNDLMRRFLEMQEGMDANL
jgi:hypothetical protein